MGLSELSEESSFVIMSISAVKKVTAQNLLKIEILNNLVYQNSNTK
jgi:hypothetical protein